VTVLNYALHRLCLHLTLVLITAIPSEGEGQSLALHKKAMHFWNSTALVATPASDLPLALQMSRR
jgi:hypothetical protein